jgi:hypothetical protein
MTTTNSKISHAHDNHATTTRTTMTTTQSPQTDTHSTLSNVTAAHAVSAPTPAAPVDSSLSSAQVQEFLQQLDEMAAALNARAAPLTIDARRRLTKARLGLVEHASSVVALADRYGLVIPGISSAATEASLSDVTSLTALEQRVGAVLGLLVDMRLQAQAHVARSASTAYKMLVRLVPEYPTLQRELTPVASRLAIQYKDAPAALRTQEAKTLMRQRATVAAKKAAAAPAQHTAAAPPYTSVNGGTTT